MKKALAVSLFLYATALMSSMSAMELFSWLSVIFAMVIYAKGKSWRKHFPFPVGIEGFLFGFWLLIIVGLLRSDASLALQIDKVADLRWILLLYGLSFALIILNPEGKRTSLFLWVSIIIGIYGIYQSLTGVDLLRDSQRAVQHMPDGGFRTAGLLSSPMTYAQSFAMLLCFILSLFFLKWKVEKKKAILALLAFVIMGLSVVTTYTRGVWIACSVAVLLMSFLYSKKWFMGLLLAGVVAVGTLFTVSPQFRARVTSLFNPKYESNHDRMVLWKANFEIFKDHPWLGMGYGENERRLGEYYSELGFTGEFKGHAHNTYIHWLAGTGLLGLSFYLVIIAFFYLLSFRLWYTIPPDQIWHRTIILGAIGAQTCFHIAGLFEANFEDAEVNHLLVFIWAHMVWLKQIYLSSSTSKA